MEATVDPQPRGPDWMPITPKTGSLFHADAHSPDALLREAQFDHQFAWPIRDRLHRFDAVDHQIDDQLLQLDPIGQDHQSAIAGGGLNESVAWGRALRPIGRRVMALYVLALLIGIIAGLQTMTAPAAVSWAAHLGWLPLDNTPLTFLGFAVTPYIITVLAIGELISDQLPEVLAEGRRRGGAERHAPQGAKLVEAERAHAVDLGLDRLAIERWARHADHATDPPSKWWTPLISSRGSRKVFDGYSASSIHG